MPHERYEAKTGGNHKFWEIMWVAGGTSLKVVWGVVGASQGITRTHKFNSARQCNNARLTFVRERRQQMFKPKWSYPCSKSVAEQLIGGLPEATTTKAQKPNRAAISPDGKSKTTIAASKPKEYGRRQRKLRL